MNLHTHTFTHTFLCTPGDSKWEAGNESYQQQQLFDRSGMFILDYVTKSSEDVRKHDLHLCLKSCCALLKAVCQTITELSLTKGS